MNPEAKHIISPFGDLGFSPERSEAEVSGHTVTVLRHPAQDPHFRTLEGTGPHGLSAGFYDQFSRSETPHLQDMEELFKWFCRDIACIPVQDKEVIITASADHFSDSILTINLRTTKDSARIVRVNELRWDVMMPVKGIALRSLRLLFLFVRIGASRLLLRNGRKADYTISYEPKFFPNVPMPQAHVQYVDIANAGRAAYPDGYLIGRKEELTYLLNTCTVYGAEENLLSRFPLHMICQPTSHHLFGAFCKHVLFNGERKYYNHRGELVCEHYQHDYNTYTSIINSFGTVIDSGSPDSFANFQESANQELKEVHSNLYTGLIVVLNFGIMSTYFIGGEDLFFPTIALFFFAYTLWFVVRSLLLCDDDDEITADNSFSNFKGLEMKVNIPLHSTSDFPEDNDPSDKLLIPTMGTRGDHVPPTFFGHLAAWVGVPVHMYKVQTASHDDLQNLKEGNLLTLLPGFLENKYNAIRGYKDIFTPHMNLGIKNSSSYTMAPPSRYINKIRYVLPEYREGLSWFRKIAVWFAETLADDFQADWNIGCLKGCNLPRSADGVSLLQRRKNYNTGNIGWLCGSANESTIPEEIRMAHERVPDGDHNEIFRRYNVIHMTGGAGAVQTAIACGAKPIIHDVNLDRDYHTLPTQDDFHQPSVYPFLGRLEHVGFNLNAPWILRKYFQLRYYIVILPKYIPRACDPILKLTFFWFYGSLHLMTWLVIFFSIPAFLRKELKDRVWNRKFLSMTMGAVWQWPVLLLSTRTWFFFIPIFMMFNWWLPLSQDAINFYKRDYQLVWEPVRYGKFEFPFPFGHWLLRDTRTNTIFEGKFVSEEDSAMGGKFRLEQHHRQLRPGHICFHVPFHIPALLEEQETKPYSANWNCTTVLIQGLKPRSLFGFVGLSLVSMLTYLVLKPPQEFRAIYEYLYPEGDYTSTFVYRALGFAGNGEIPLEHVSPQKASRPAQASVDVLEQDPLLTVMENNPLDLKLLTEDEIDWVNSTQAIKDVENQLIHMLGYLHETELQAEEKIHLIESVLERVMLSDQSVIPLPTEIKHLTIPLSSPGTWEELVDFIYEAMRNVLDYRLVKGFIDWLKGVGDNLAKFLSPILSVLAKTLKVAYQHSKIYANKLYHAMCRLLDYAWGGVAPSRIKAAWGLTELIPPGLVSTKARIAAESTYCEFIGRKQFLDDYEDFVQKIKGPAKGLPGSSKIGGPQRRAVKIHRPVMSHQAAEIIGLSSDEYVADEDYQRRIDGYLREGIPQAVDGVLFGAKHPDRIHRSIVRYEPQYESMDPTDKAFIHGVADELFKQYPEVFANADIMPLDGVEKYIKVKYSPGSPFIRHDGYGSRRALQESGIMQIIKENAMKAISSGVYPVQFYHAFVKSQAVDGTKLLPPKNKDLRTVVSQDIPSYFIDQLFQIERNKRLTWETYGAGAGMPLGQPMAKIFDSFAELKAKEGGHFIIADATAYDSKAKPVLFEGAAYLAEKGFESHWSGKGKQFASVLRAKYSAMQNAWTFGITEPTYSSLVFCVPDQRLASRLAREHKQVIMFPELLETNNITKEKWEGLSYAERQTLSHSLVTPENRVVLTQDPCVKPHDSHWQGSFIKGKEDGGYRKHQTYFYDDEEILIGDISRVIHANRDLVSNVHHKNRGGGTGQSATSWDNTLTFKLGVIGAYCRATGRTPAEFFERNKLFNTSDDTAWWSRDLLTGEEVDKFKLAALEFGIRLELGTTKNITEVEYLSKFPRPPTREDSEDYKAWRASRIDAMRKVWAPSQIHAFTEQKMPNFFIVQNPSAIILRRSAYRYYQGSLGRHLYTSVERGSGHSLVTAFQPALYKRFALEWCEDMNKICSTNHVNQHWKLLDQHDRKKMRVENVNPNWKRGFKATPRQESLLKWQRQFKFPSYGHVLHLHLHYKDPDPMAHEKFLAKLDRTWRGNDEALNEFVDGLYHVTDLIPKEIKKFTPGVDMLYAEVPWKTYRTYIEMFLYLKALETIPESELTFQVFDSIVRESPYAVAVAPGRFWDKLKDREFKEKVLKTPVRALEGCVLFISVIYFLTHWVELWIQMMPWIGAIYNLVMWSFVGASKVFALANTLVWHSRGRSSRQISAIMPKDPYMWSKRLVVTISDFLPVEAGLIFIAPCLFNELLANFIEIGFGRIWSKGMQIREVGSDNNAPVNPWANYAKDYIVEAKSHKKVILTCGTGTGKSTFFPAACWAERKETGINKIWVVQPRKILIREWKIPFKIPSQKLKRGVVFNPNADIFLTTYGHFLNRLKEVKSNDLVIFDEFHEMDGFMLRGLEEWGGTTFLVSATPISVPGLQDLPILNPSIPKRFKKTVFQSETEDVVAMWSQMKEYATANDMAHLLDRPLVIVPTFKDVDKAIAGLEYFDKSVTWTEVSSRQPIIPPTGGIVATPYLQTGLDLSPPAKCLVDCGRDFVLHKGGRVLPNPYTSAIINEQRTNRVGRVCDGLVIQPIGAGSSPEPVKYPSGLHFSSKLVSSYYKVPQLTPVANFLCPSLSFLSVRGTVSIKKSVATIYLFSLLGVPRNEWQTYYTRHLEQEMPFPEEFEIINRCYSEMGCRNNPIIPYNQAMHHLLAGAAIMGFNGVETVTQPMYPFNGKWVLEPGKADTPTEKKVRELLAADTEPWKRECQRQEAISKTLKARVDKLTSHLLSLGEALKKTQLPHLEKQRMAKFIPELERQGTEFRRNVRLKPRIVPAFDDQFKPIYRQVGLTAIQEGKRCHVCDGDHPHEHRSYSFVLPEGFKTRKGLTWAFEFK